MTSEPESVVPDLKQGDYRVVVFATTEDPHQFRDLLVEQLGMHPTDAMILVHATPGILPERLDQQAAEKLAAAIEGMGVTAEVISREDIPNLEHSKHVHNVRLLEEGLETLSAGGNQEALIPWEEVELLSVGQIPGNSTRHYFFDNDLLTASRRRYIAPDELEGASTMVLWVLSKFYRQGFRLEKTHMNFSDLGSRMTTSASQNFHLFVQEIAARSPQAFLTPATQTYLGHGTLRHLQFGSEEELQQYTAFHLLRQDRLRHSETA